MTLRERMWATLSGCAGTLFGTRNLLLSWSCYREGHIKVSPGPKRAHKTLPQCTHTHARTHLFLHITFYHYSLTDVTNRDEAQVRNYRQQTAVKNFEQQTPSCVLYTKSCKFFENLFITKHNYQILKRATPMSIPPHNSRVRHVVITDSSNPHCNFTNNLTAPYPSNGATIEQRFSFQMFSLSLCTAAHVPLTAIRSSPQQQRHFVISERRDNPRMQQQHQESWLRFLPKHQLL
jgi:hypothetical protein